MNNATTLADRLVLVIFIVVILVSDLNDGSTIPDDVTYQYAPILPLHPSPKLSNIINDRLVQLKVPNGVPLHNNAKSVGAESTVPQPTEASTTGRVPEDAHPPTFNQQATPTEKEPAKPSIAPHADTPKTVPTPHLLHDFPTTTTPSPSALAEDTCPPIIGNLDKYTQNQFTSILTHDCRYDKLTKPHTNGPLNVTVQIDIRHIESVEQLQFKMHMLVQYKYRDHRLNYEQLSPTRGMMLGQDILRNKIWIPHLVLANEKDTTIMGLGGKDVFVSISPKGDVIFSYRMTAQIYCWMDLKKFPFDEQVCDIMFKSWTYNASNLVLYWDVKEPVKVAGQLHLTEFSLKNFWSLSAFVPAPLEHGAFVGNYSVLIFKFEISREIGYYIMDYFVPSILLVCTSWVTFWLQADNAAPRVTLGTSTMLSFITLASGLSKNLPKVSYIKASEIWFLGCTLFIFASMAEFAFVNIIWRRRKKVELKKVNSKYILKSTLTPRLARKDFQRSSSVSNLHKSHSCSSLDDSGANKVSNNGSGYNNYLTVHSFVNIPTITTQSDDELLTANKQESNSTVSVPSNPQLDQNHKAQKWTTMTPQEIAIWIDKRSRIVFPAAFLVFNIFYFSFVYIL